MMAAKLPSRALPQSLGAAKLSNVPLSTRSGEYGQWRGSRNGAMRPPPPGALVRFRNSLTSTSHRFMVNYLENRREGTPMRRMVSSFLAGMVGLSVLVAVASLASAATSYTFTTIDVPGTFETVPEGINDAGQIVGFFVVSGTVPTSQGFLRDTGGSFTTINVPSAPNATEPRGINNPGQIVGIFSD